VTELADTLTREHGLAFKASHAVAVRLVAGARATPNQPLASLLRDVSKAVTGTAIVYSDERLAEILSPRHFVAVRTTHGGPSPSEIGRAIGESKNTLSEDEDWLRCARERLRAAGEKLKDAADRL